MRIFHFILNINMRTQVTLLSLLSIFVIQNFKNISNGWLDSPYVLYKNRGSWPEGFMVTARKKTVRSSLLGWNQCLLLLQIIHTVYAI
jgi:hypothetical protein